MKIWLGDAFALAVVALLAPVLLLLGVAFCAMLFLIALVFWLNPRTKLTGGITRLQCAWELLGVLLVVIAVSAPFRALTVGIWSQVPPVLRMADFWLAPLHVVFGPHALAEVDRGWALVGAVALAVFALLDGGWRLLQARQIRLLPTSRARSVAVGLAELAGVARPIDSGAAIGEPILGWRYEVGEDSVRRVDVLRPFWLEDDTGRVLIDPRGAEFMDRARQPGTNLGGKLHGFGLRTCHVMLTREHGRTRDGARMQWLHAGDPVYVIGNVLPRSAWAAEGIPHDAQVVVAPRQSLSGFRFHDVFVLSDADEVTTERMLRSGVVGSLLWSLIGISLCAWLWTIADAGRTDPVAAYGYAPVPYDVETLAGRDQPVSSRRADVLDTPDAIWRRTRTVDWMLDALRTQPVANARRFIPYLHALGARTLAMQVLAGLVANAADPERAAFARDAMAHWPDGGPDFRW